MHKPAAALTLAALALLSAAVPALAQNRVQQVDTFLGTSTTPDGSDVIDDFPGADVPFGMVQWSPDTPAANAGGGYEYNDKAITGFSLTHLSGPGCGVFGDFRILPVSGAVSDPAHASQPFLHANETAVPGYYAVTLGDPGIRSEISVTQRTGIARFTFPAGSQANLLFNVASDQAGVRNAGFRVTGRSEVEGFADTGGFCGMPDRYSVYFVAQFDKPIAASGVWRAKQTFPGTPSIEGPDAGGWVTFDTSKSATVGVRVSISFVDTAGARANLRADKLAWNFEAVRMQALGSWENMLERIDVSGGTPAEQRQFYTAFYHAMLHPNIFDDADGRYRGYDRRVHHVRMGHHEYANFSDWDIYRTLVPFQALMVPAQVSDMMQSLVDAAGQDEFLPRWALVNGATSVMGGDSVDPVIAGAYAFGARAFDAQAALAAMVKGASAVNEPPADGWYVERPELREYLQRGYIVNTHTTSVSPVPNGASETLEYALDDFSIARFARSIGNERAARAFMRRSANWANLFDTATGWIAPRDASGAFEQTPVNDAGQSGFQEGNAAQYTWMVPQDLAGLVRGMGGRAAARAKLDTFFTQINAGQDKPYAWLGNEPTLGSPWVYLYAGAPWRAQAVVRQSLTTMFADTPHGIPGNDDLGTMSAWYMWCAMGLYPQNPSVRILDIGSPLFSRIVLHTGGPAITIDAPQAADGAPFVNGLTINGKSSQNAWLALPMRGTVALHFTLGTSPDPAWGASPQDAPPSFVASPVRFPDATRVTLSATDLSTHIDPAKGATVSFVFDNPAGSTPETVRWSVPPIAGLTVSPSSGETAIPAGAHQEVTLRVRAADSRPGIWNLPVFAQARNGARIAPLRYALEIDPFFPAFIANRFDDSVMPFDPRTQGVGEAIAAGKEARDEVFSPDRRFLYVADRAAQSLAVLDIAARTVAYVKVGQSPNGTAITPDGKTVWVANYDDSTVQPVDAATRRAGKAIAVGLNPRYVAISPDGKTLYATNQNGNTVTVIALPQGTRVADIPVGAHPSGIAVAPDGRMAYVANSGTNDVTPIDLAAQHALAPIASGLDASMIAISPDGKTAAVSNFAGMSITLIDLATRTPHVVQVGLSPYGVAFTPDSRTVWVAMRGDSALVPVDVLSRRAGTPVAVYSNSPYSIVIP